MPLPIYSLIVNQASVDYFLMALYYLRKYPTGHDHSQHFDVSRETITKWTWFFLDRISALQSQKIVWPAEWEKERYAAAKLRGEVEGEVYVVGFGCTVDGTHGPIHEPSVGETRAKNPVYYSHKTNGPAFAYEFALDIFQDRLVWMNGPFPASTPDREIFKNGLMEKIPEGMRVIADRGYSGQPLQHIISLPNPYDNAQLKNFKARASARQEDFNSLLKKFKICELTFRHDRDRIQKHKTAWTAVAIICQYHFEIDKSLWDV